MRILDSTINKEGRLQIFAQQQLLFFQIYCFIPTSDIHTSTGPNCCNEAMLLNWNT